jgi:hypothetical protein
VLDLSMIMGALDNEAIQRDFESSSAAWAARTQLPLDTFSLGG